MIEASLVAKILEMVVKELSVPVSELAVMLKSKGYSPAEEELAAIVDELNRKHLVTVKDIGEGDELVSVTAEGVVALESKANAKLAGSLVGEF